MWAYLTGAKGPSGFGSASKAEDVAKAYDDQVKGKVVLVTGAASGIGFETARVLAVHGATVYVGARSLAKCEEAITAIRATAPQAELKLKPFVADLSSLKTIKAGVDTFLAENVPLNILINNAGVMACPLGQTEDGLETQFGTNHIGHYYLTTLLLKKLQDSAPARVVSLSSSAHAMCYGNGIQFDDLDGKKRYSAWPRYGHSKLANILFIRVRGAPKAARSPRLVLTAGGGGDRIADRAVVLYTAQGMHARAVPGVSFYSLHPGVIRTNLQRHMTLMPSWFDFPGGKNVPQGAATTVFCALSDKAVAGEYHQDCNVVNSSSHRHFKDLDMAKRLLEVSETIVQSKMA